MHIILGIILTFLKLQNTCNSRMWIIILKYNKKVRWLSMHTNNNVIFKLWFKDGKEEEFFWDWCINK